MAFWMDPLLLIASGVIIAYIAKKWMYNSDTFVPCISALLLAVFFFISVGLFCNIGMLESTWELMGAESGTEYMVNGIIFNIVAPGAYWGDISGWGMFACIIMFVLYPFWLWAGIVLGRKMFGSAPV